MSNRFTTLTVLLALTVCPSLSLAAERRAASSYATTQLGLRGNPTGLRLSNTAAWRMPLASDDGVLWKTTYLELGGGLMITPVSLFPSVHVELVPIAPLVVRLQSTQVTYLGVLGHALTFTQDQIDAGRSQGEYWSPEAVEQMTGTKPGEWLTGWDHSLSGTLQLKYGAFIAKASMEYHWIDLELPTGDVRWYDSTLNLIMGAGERLRIAKGLVGYVASGALNSERFILLGTSYEDQRTQADDLSRQMLGLMTVWRPGWMPKQQLTMGVVGQYYIDDAADHRTGQVMTIAFTQLRFGTNP